MYAKLELYIDGQWLNGEGRAGEDVINPATQKPLAHLPHATTADPVRPAGGLTKALRIRYCAVAQADSPDDAVHILLRLATVVSNPRPLDRRVENPFLQPRVAPIKHAAG